MASFDILHHSERGKMLGKDQKKPWATLPRPVMSLLYV